MMKKMITKTADKAMEMAGIALGRVWFCICFIIGLLAGLVIAYIRKQIQEIKQIVQQFKMLRQFEFSKNNHFCDFIFEGHVFHIHKNVYMNKLNIYAACVCGRPFVQIRKISIDNLFIDKFSTETKLFFLAHEASHVLNGDFTFRNMKKAQKAVSKCGSTEQAAIAMAQRQYDRELMADRRAAESVGFTAARNALKETYKFFPYEEIISRYEALGGNKEDLTNPIKEAIGWTISSINVEEIHVSELDDMD